MSDPSFWRAQSSETSIYDLVGIGFGPSNLALATTIQEESELVSGRALRCLFLERRREFGWHPGLLLDGARVQLSFLKDLVTLRNPCSRFTFLNYLRERNRLDHFANLRNMYPTRLEFNDYYRWAAEQVRDVVYYGHEVVSVEPVRTTQASRGARVDLLRVRAREIDAQRSVEFLTRNLVLAVGGVPALPQGIDLRGCRRVFHAQEFLPRLAVDYPDRDAAYRFVVVGSGQTAAEVFQHLLSRYPRAEITATLRRFAYKPADDSHFVNEIFFPEMIDFVYRLPAERRRALFSSHADTNYSAVDVDLIQEIYEELYQARVAGEERARILRFHELRGFAEHDEKLVLHFHDSLANRPVELEADAAILATGYVRPGKPEILGPVQEYLDVEEDRYAVERNYRIRSREDFLPRIFLQGFCESTHGISDTLLSNLAKRSVEILGALATVDTVGAVQTIAARDEAGEPLSKTVLEITSVAGERTVSL
jgi:L-ornithine N5-monooxygenase